MFPTVLIVEDHDGIRLSVRNWLNINFPSWGLLEAKNGEEALAVVSTHLPNVVLMDIGLPGMNGIEATRRIKLALPNLQVIMLTSYESTELQNEAVAAGASAYILKHKMIYELVPALRELLEIGETSRWGPWQER
jgi:DNA-binding NarL/FixJ family response regulator